METCKDLEQEGNHLGAAVFRNLTISIAKYRRCSNKVLWRGKSYGPVGKIKEGGKKPEEEKFLKSSGTVMSPKICKVKQKPFSPLPNMIRHCLGKTLMSADLKKGNEETKL